MAAEVRCPLTTCAIFVCISSVFTAFLETALSSCTKNTDSTKQYPQQSPESSVCEAFWGSPGGFPVACCIRSMLAVQTEDRGSPHGTHWHPRDICDTAHGKPRQWTRSGACCFQPAFPQQVALKRSGYCCRQHVLWTLPAQCLRVFRIIYITAITLLLGINISSL